jgi:hypothetical protein
MDPEFFPWLADVNNQDPVLRPQNISHRIVLFFFFEFSPGGKNPHLNLYSVAYKALQPMQDGFKGTRVTRGN